MARMRTSRVSMEVGTRGARTMARKTVPVSWQIYQVQKHAPGQIPKTEVGRSVALTSRMLGKTVQGTTRRIKGGTVSRSQAGLRGGYLS